MFRRALTAALPRSSSFAASRLSYSPARCLLHSATRASATSSSRRRYATSTSRTCPQCSAALTTPLPVCTKCYWISNIPHEMTYHEMLGVPYEPNPFVVDTTAIKRHLRQLQTAVHPDRWVGKPRVRTRSHRRAGKRYCRFLTGSIFDAGEARRSSRHVVAGK